jgi:hypothetical protein
MWDFMGESENSTHTGAAGEETLATRAGLAQYGRQETIVRIGVLQKRTLNETTFYKHGQCKYQKTVV